MLQRSVTLIRPLIRHSKLPLANSVTLEKRSFGVSKPSSGIFSSNSLEMRDKGISLFVKCSVGMDPIDFMDKLRLPDTFNSWFKVMELHTWILSLRLTQDPSSASQDLFISIRNYMIEALWMEAYTRVGALGIKGRKRNSSLDELSDQYRVNFILYDDGILGDDSELARALWEGFFNKKEDILVEELERLIIYVRGNLLMLEKLENTEFVFKNQFTWIPLKSSLTSK